MRLHLTEIKIWNQSVTNLIQSRFVKTILELDYRIDTSSPSNNDIEDLTFSVFDVISKLRSKKSSASSFFRLWNSESALLAVVSNTGRKPRI